MSFKINRWSEIAEEQITPLLSRKVIWGTNLDAALLHLKKGCTIATHQHVSEQFTQIIKGAIRFRIGGEEVTAHAGDIVVIPSNVPHEAHAVEDTDALDTFSPRRDDWRRNEIDYMKSR